MKYSLPLILSGLLLTFSAWAQVLDTNQVILLEEISIQEQRMEIPFSESTRNIAILDKSTLQQMPVQSLAEALSFVGGVDVRQRGVYGTSTDISIRGGSFEQTLILLNGVKLSDPQTGHHNFALPLHFWDVSQVEVLKGAGARAFGQNAFSGVINIITDIPDERRVKLRSYGGDFGLYGAALSLSLPVGDNYRQQISVSRDASDGYRHNTDFVTHNLFYQSSLRTGEQSQLEFMASLADRKFGANGFYASPSATEQYEEVTTSLLSLTYRLEKDKFRLTPRLYWRRNEDEYLFVRNRPEIYRNLHLGQVLGAELHASLDSKTGTTGFGIESRNEFLHSNNLGERERQNIGLFAEHRFRLMNNNLQITAGVYANYYSDYGWQAFPGFEFGYQLSPSIRAFGNIGRSYRVPTYTELYYEDPNNRSNPNLRPEEALNYELGLRYLPPQMGIEITANYFWQDGTDLVDWVKYNADDKWNVQNIRNSLIQGLELNTNLNFAQIASPSFWLNRLSLSYTYINAEANLQEGLFNSRYALDNLRHQLQFGLNHKIFRNIYHESRLRYLDRATLADYWVWDMRLAWQKGDKMIFAEASNMTNSEYSEVNLVPMPGRWFRAGIQWDFNW